jgi:hypothetical protein
MKVLFFVKAIADAHVARALANIMCERMSPMKFAAIVYRESGEGHYLRSTSADLISPILSESEMHIQSLKNEGVPDTRELERIEREYGAPTIWQYVTQNRWLTMRRNGYLYKYGSAFSRDQLLTHVLTRFTMIEQFVDRFQPDIIVYAGYDVGASSSIILSVVASARKIPVVVPLHTRVGSYLTLIDTVYSRSHTIETRYHALRSGAKSVNRGLATQLLEQFRGGGIKLSYASRRNVVYDQLVQKNTLPLQQITRSVSTLSQKTVDYYRKSRAKDPFNVSWFRRRYDDMLRNSRRSLISNMKINPARSEKYVYFPLHVEPELSLLLYAPFYTNQLAVIQNIAQSLPADTCLYVKEHPAALGSRPLKYYKELSKIPNVQLVSPRTKSLDLIRHSKGVVTITGTSGMEAMLLGKPTITLGDVYYNFADELVHHTHEFEQIPALVKQFDNFAANESAVLDFLSSLLDESIDLDLNAIASTLVYESTRSATRHADLLTYADYLIQHIDKLKRMPNDSISGEEK